MGVIEAVAQSGVTSHRVIMRQKFNTGNRTINYLRGSRYIDTLMTIQSKTICTAQ